MIQIEVSKLNQSIAGTRALLKLREMMGRDHPKMMNAVRASEEKNLPSETPTKHRILKNWDQLSRLFAKNGEVITEVIHEQNRDVVITESDNS
jgi:hypothetical protein